MLEIGSLVDGKYRILQKIGQGGMSIVYLARNERANKQWAIKEVRKDGTQNFEVVKQGLVAEIDMLKRFNHPNLPSIIDVIDGTDSFLIVMDYVEGNPLDKAIAATGAQSQENVIEWSKELCDVLGYLHSRTPPIIYRDMKPANVMVKPDGHVVLIDFGTAREYKNNSVADTTCLGTRGYAAPEQYGGQGQTDARTDIYCLGATMYHLLTGHNPSEYPYEMYPIRQWNPALSSGLEAIILKCTQKRPEDRYQSCAELYYALENYWQEDSEVKQKNNTRWKLFVTSCVISVVMAITGVGLLIGKNNVTMGTYDSYLKLANNQNEEYEDRLDNFAKAIDLDPENEKGYNQLLKLFTSVESDNGAEFTSVEHSYLIKNVLEHSNSSRGGERNVEIFERESPEEYASFAFELGDYYYFRFKSADGDSQSGARKAKQWYDSAISTGLLDSKKESRAETLSTMAENLDSIGKIDVDGSPLMSYSDYWNNIEKLLNSVRLDNMQIRLEIYRYALSEIVTKSGDFIDDSVATDRMYAVINQAVSLTEDSEVLSDVRTNNVSAQLLSTIKGENGGVSLIDLARSSIAISLDAREKRAQALSLTQEEAK